MARKNLMEILKDAKIDLKEEYDRLYILFYCTPDSYRMRLFEYCENHFWDMPFRGTCLNINDFEETHDICFEEEPDDFDLDYLVSFCEYTYNLAYRLATYNQLKRMYIQQIKKVLALINHEFILDKKEHVYILVQKSETVIAVAEIVESKIAFSVLQYNHHSLKGDLIKKHAILKHLADDIELQRKKLKSINGTLESQLFQMFHNFIRHTTEGNEYVESLSATELEKCYDDIYQMWLLAKLELDNVERKRRISKILGDINSKKTNKL